MTISNGLCDSCNNPSDILFPVAILDELPTGGMKHVQRWYCIDCKDELEQEAEENKDKKEDGEEDEEDEFSNSTNSEKSSICNVSFKMPRFNRQDKFDIENYRGVNW